MRDFEWSAVAADRPGYATYPDTRPGGKLGRLRPLARTVVPQPADSLSDDKPCDPARCAWCCRAQSIAALAQARAAAFPEINEPKEQP